MTRARNKRTIADLRVDDSDLDGPYGAVEIVEIPSSSTRGRALPQAVEVTRPRRLRARLGASNGSSQPSGWITPQRHMELASGAEFDTVQSRYGRSSGNNWMEESPMGPTVGVHLSPIAVADSVSTMERCLEDALAVGLDDEEFVDVCEPPDSAEEFATACMVPIEVDESKECPICMEDMGDSIRGKPNACIHTFCLKCIQTWAEKTNLCPLCKCEFASIVRSDNKSSIHVNCRRLAPDEFMSSDDFEEEDPEDEDDSDDPFFVGSDEESPSSLLISSRDQCAFCASRLPPDDLVNCRRCEIAFHLRCVCLSREDWDASPLCLYCDRAGDRGSTVPRYLDRLDENSFVMSLLRTHSVMMQRYNSLSTPSGINRTNRARRERHLLNIMRAQPMDSSESENQEPTPPLIAPRPRPSRRRPPQRQANVRPRRQNPTRSARGGSAASAVVVGTSRQAASNSVDRPSLVERVGQRRRRRS